MSNKVQVKKLPKDIIVKFLFIDDLEELLKDVVVQAVFVTLLRHNSIETATLNSKKALTSRIGFRVDTHIGFQYNE